ncbi:MAG: hypothetical protein J7M14_07325, partial [Planctomycetes bacterium]|nr:hypothetical protein [Planctomycetota bacterium]
ALTEMFRCAKPSGRVVIGTLNRNAAINQDRLARGKEPYASGRLFTPRELDLLLKPFGRVRMATTHEHSGRRPLQSSWRRIIELFTVGLTARRDNLDGAFIVAEVGT